MEIISFLRIDGKQIYRFLWEKSFFLERGPSNLVYMQSTGGLTRVSHCNNIVYAVMKILMLDTSSDDENVSPLRV